MQSLDCKNLPDTLLLLKSTYFRLIGDDETGWTQSNRHFWMALETILTFLVGFHVRRKRLSKFPDFPSVH